MSVPRLDLAPKLKRPLQLWNPLDYLRLLYWCFFFPQALRWYVETFANRSYRKAAMAFQSLLLGLFLATMPSILVRAVQAYRPSNELVLIGGALSVLTWLATLRDPIVGARAGVRSSALIGFILCVESARQL
jgi:hypothetical protein